jgi:hypothetical protein
MKKGGTGKPQNPDIALDAEVRMRELHFERAPEPEVCFRGNTRRNSVWESKRENLPDEVQEGVIYRDAGVRLRIASEVVVSNPEVWNSWEKERIKADTESDKWNSRDKERIQADTESDKERKGYRQTRSTRDGGPESKNPRVERGNK